jgi:phytanoyl-CoA dioxygenase PhyH
MSQGAPPDLDAFDYLISTRGWAVFPGVLDAETVAALSADAERAYAACRPVQLANDVAANQDGVAHHVVGYGGALDAFLERLPLVEAIERYFGGKWILTSYSAARNAPGKLAYTAKAHRDVRAFTSGYRLSLNMLVMLTDFTLENGATEILSGSHTVGETPPMAVFDRYAERITGKAGDIALFNSLTVHRAAANRSDQPRRLLTLTMGRPYLKPQMDWPRFLSEEAQARLSPATSQMLGFNARVAASLDEYYQPPERWTFKADQR